MELWLRSGPGKRHNYFFLFFLFGTYFLFYFLTTILILVSSSCSLKNGLCSDFCLLNPAGYQCSCPIGVPLLQDGKTCDHGEYKAKSCCVVKVSKNGIDNGSSAYLDKELWVVDNLNYFIRYFTNNTIRIIYKNSEQCLQKKPRRYFID